MKKKINGIKININDNLKNKIEKKHNINVEKEIKSALKKLKN